MVSDTNSTRRSYLKGLAGTGAVGIAGCVGGGSDDGTIALAASSGASFGQLITDVIIEEGLDEQNGITIDVTEAGPGDVPQLVLNGSVDTGFGSPEGMAEARTQGHNVSIYGPWNANHTSLLSPSGAGYEGLEDLQGETLGILSPPSGIWNHTKLLASEYGLNLEEDFDLREGAPPAILEWIKGGDVDAGILFYPLIVPDLVAGEIEEVAFMPTLLEEEFGRLIDFVNLIALDDWLEEDQERAANVQQTLIDAHSHIRDQPVEVLEEYGEPIGIETDEQIDFMAEKLPDIVPGWDTDEAQESIPAQIELAKEQGVIPDDAPTDIVADI